MSYLVIARKYRPNRFEDVIGQDHVTRTIMNSITNNKVHHAYILTGPRGVGKTSISRILAKALNCEQGLTAHPCGVCKNCLEIESGSSIDVQEIDGASNRGIEEIRKLREEIKFAPISCRKKIYIIDEVHMLTTPAFNALLKTLEEPPDHAVFIFATTEINEVPPTILSRCQRHDFKRVNAELVAKSLGDICKKENVNIDTESLLMIARAGDGSVRDSQSVLDQVIAYCGNNIVIKEASEALGLPTFDLYFSFLDIVITHKNDKLFYFVDSLFKAGIDYTSFLKGIIDFFRNMLVLKSTKDEKLINFTKETIINMEKYISLFNENDFLLFLDILSQGIISLKNSSLQKVDFEIILLKIVNFASTTKIETLLTQMDSLNNDGEINFDFILDKVSKKISSDFISNNLLPNPPNINTNTAKPDIVIEKEDDQNIEASNSNQEAQLDKTDQERTIAEIQNEDIQSPINNTEEESQIDKTIDEKIESSNELEKEETDVIEEKIPEPIEEETIRTTPLTIDEVKENWNELADKITKKLPSIGKMWEYATPISLTDYSMTVKFDPDHNTYKDLCVRKSKEISEIFKNFFHTEVYKIKYIMEITENDERIIQVKSTKTLTAEEKKIKLLEKAPQLEFLFKAPLNGRIVK